LIFQSITSPRASVTERLFLLKTKRPEFSWNNGARLTSIMAGLQGDMSNFVGNGKSWTSRGINALGRPRSAPAATTLWQREFFDHVLRSCESYAEKWNYVRDNPVRDGLVSSADDWPYAGEVEMLML